MKNKNLAIKNSKFLRIISVLLFIALFILVISCFVQATVCVASATNDNINVMKYYNNIIDGYKLNEADDNNDISYKEEFAGAFIDDDGSLKIGIVEDYYNEHNTKSNARVDVDFVSNKYSYNCLSRIMSEVENIMIDNSIISVEIDEKRNAVVIDLMKSENRNYVVEYLSEKGLFFEDSIVFNIDDNCYITNTAATVTAYSGESVFYYADESKTRVNIGTICVGAIDNKTGQFGVLTNEHVALASQQKEMYYGGCIKNNNIYFNPLGIASKGKMGGDIDAAFIPYADQEKWDVSQYSEYDTTVFSNVNVGDESQIIQGQPLMKIGQTTGVNYGSITSKNVSIVVDGIRIEKVFKYDNETLKGDSGGPVYYNDGTNLHLIGMNFAASEVLGIKRGVACRISNVMKELDVTPITNNTLLTTQTANEIEINKICSQIAGDIYIPESVNGKAVVAIGNGAFAHQTEICKIYMPSTLKTIGANAFQNCTNLQYAIFKEDSKLTSIGNGAFYNSGLWHFDFPAGVSAIGPNTFENCTELMAVGFAENNLMSSIGNGAFYGCTLLSAITIPVNVSTIGANAFENCSLSIRCEFESGSKLTIIGNSAFSNTQIENISIPAGATTLGYNVFSGCSEMNAVLIPNSVTSVGGGAFSGCSGLTIYTSASSPPSGWIGGWNSLNRPIVLGCQLQDDYVVSFEKTMLNPFNANAENGLNNPYRFNYEFEGWYITSDFSGIKYDNISNAPNGILYAKWVKKESCVAKGTLITLADGTQKPVEELTGDEELLVWNLFTGRFDSAPILFVDMDAESRFRVVNLTFSDGTVVKVISEHAFWDVDLNEYVYLREDAAKYIGHWFYRHTADDEGNLKQKAVQLVKVEVKEETTTAYSPVTYGHLCYYVNGMLSMPGGITGLFNIFDVDAQTMCIDTEKMNEDIARYGLFAYEEFNEICPVPQQMFEAVNGQYLKVAIGKENISLEEISALIKKYVGFFVSENKE